MLAQWLSLFNALSERHRASEYLFFSFVRHPVGRLNFAYEQSLRHLGIVSEFLTKNSTAKYSMDPPTEMASQPQQLMRWRIPESVIAQMRVKL